VKLPPSFSDDLLTDNALLRPDSYMEKFHYEEFDPNSANLFLKSQLFMDSISNYE
jgi:hypothetical protein